MSELCEVAGCDRQPSAEILTQDGQEWVSTGLYCGTHVDARIAAVRYEPTRPRLAVCRIGEKVQQ